MVKADVEKTAVANAQGIGTLREGGLHRDLKAIYAELEGQTEQRVGKFVVDVLTDDRIYEIQTANFTSFRDKLQTLLKTHDVTVVFPIAAEKTLVKSKSGKTQRRKSPRRGRMTDVFDELVHMPTLLDHPRLSLELIFVHMEEWRVFDAKRAWRRNHWVVAERRLASVLDIQRFNDMSELFDAVSSELAEQMTTRSIATGLGITRRLAQKVAYCFRQAGVIEASGKKGNAVIYRRVEQ